MSHPGLRLQVTGSLLFDNTPLKTNMTLENPHGSIGNASSNGCFSIVNIVMLVFWGVIQKT